jgi:hypothetical protein
VLEHEVEGQGEIRSHFLKAVTKSNDVTPCNRQNGGQGENRLGYRVSGTLKKSTCIGSFSTEL